MPEGSVYQGHHAVGEVVLVEKLASVHLAFEERVQTKDRRATVGNKNRVAWGAMGF